MEAFGKGTTLVTRQAARVLMECLRAEGVDRVFGNPGTTELPFVQALAGTDGLDYYLGLQEIVCLGMADGYAQATGRPAVANLHSSPGLGNAMGALYNAWRAQTPLVVTVGQQDTRFNYENPLLYSDVIRQTVQYTKWSWEIRRPEEIPTVLARAFKLAAEPPMGPVVISLPMDILDEQTDVEAVAPGARPRNGPPHGDDIAEICDVLGRSSTPHIVVGDRIDTAEAHAAILALAEQLEAAVWVEPLARKLPFPPDHRLFRGFLPPFGPLATSALVKADSVTIIGADAFLFYPPYEKTAIIDADVPVVHIDTHADPIGSTIPVSAGAYGDIALGISLVAAGVGGDRDSAATPAAADASVRRFAEKVRALSSTAPAHPFVVAEAVSRISRGEAVVEEAVSFTGALQKAYPLNPPGERFASRSGGLGWGVPAALGVALARPGRRTVAVIGDGSSMYAIQGLWTAARYRLGLTFVILDNGGYEIIRAGSRRQGFGADGTYIGTDLSEPAIDWGGLARSMGLQFHDCVHPDEIGPANERFIAAGGPGLLRVPLQTGYTLP